MAIKAKCGNCGTGFKAKPQLAGRKVKCPKCKNPLKIPAAGASAEKSQKKKPSRSAKPAKASAGVGAANPMFDLLRDAGVESVAAGPSCMNCGASMGPAAIICVDCGFNAETGQHLRTETGEDGGEGGYDLESNDAEKLIAKADRELDENEISDIDPDFGDGADSMLIAAVAGIVMVVLVGIGLAVIFLMDQIAEFISPPMISFCASIGLYLMCAIWITIVAFMMKPVQGIICTATAGLYCIVFGFMQGKTLILPTIILLASIFIGLLSYVFAFYFQPEPF